jgi:hypothetical protein
MRTPDEQAVLEAMANDLRRAHPNLADALQRWEPPPDGFRERLRAAGPLTCIVVALFAADLLWLLATSIWACT